MKRITLACAIALLGGAALVAQQAPTTPQDQPPVFRSSVNYVQVDAIVTDKDGRPVTDLKPEDFEVVENGEQQKIAEFSFVYIPTDRVEPPLLIAGKPIEADVLSNGRPEGRIYFIVLDDIHISGKNSIKAKDVARTFIEHHVGSNDVAAVIFTGSSAKDAQDFTNNRMLMLSAVDRLVGRKTVPDEGVVVPVITAAMGLEKRQTVKALVDVFNFLKDVPGRRKAMLLISEGFALNLDDALLLDASLGLEKDLEDAAKAAASAGVSIYPVDPRGLDTGVDASPRLLDTAVGDRAADFSERAGLRGLAADTGGFATVNSNRFDEQFDRVVAENSSYYLLGYYTSDRRDAATRPTVRLKRDGLHVRVRGSIQTPDGRKPSSPGARPATGGAIAAASRSPVAIGDVVIRVAASIHKGSDKKNAIVALVTDVDISRFDFKEEGGRFNNEQLVLRYLTTDAAGKVRPPIDRFTIDLKMRRATFQRTKDRGVRVVSRLVLPPGRYQVRIAAGHEASEAGSVVYDLDVPDFSKVPLAMSGVMFTTKKDADVFTIRPADPDRQQWWSSPRFVATPPTTVREFVAADIVGLVSEFYVKDRKMLQALVLRAELIGADGRVVKALAEERPPATAEGDRFIFSPQLSLQGVPPGRYVLRVEGRAGSKDKEIVARNVEIHVKG